MFEGWMAISILLSSDTFLGSAGGYGYSQGADKPSWPVVMPNTTAPIVTAPSATLIVRYFAVLVPSLLPISTIMAR